MSEDQTQPTALATTETSSIFSDAIVQILPDGRVEAIFQSVDEPEDEIVVRTSQQKAAMFIVNDVAGTVMEQLSKEEGFGVK